MALEIRETGTVVVGRSAAGLAVFPNPATDQQLRFALERVPAAEATRYTYRLLTPYGRAVRQGQGTQAPVSLAGLPAGAYLLELTGPQGQRLTRRVQINP
ncbi:T9SS type A sorting domain-containing protein [Hymenobacter koreensis]|uniref:T9SS type A sorting domain-containing protein n=1 Tax=Hymenobacter koreensis TaxID=1084523 RepID=A0ABP8JMU6_9BACT